MTTKKKLLVPAMMSRAGWELIERRADVHAVPYDYSVSTAAFHALLHDVDGVALGLTPLGEAELQAAPRLRVVARHGVGYDSVDVAALTRRGIPLMVTGTANSPSVAEEALFFMLTLAKRGAAMQAMVQQGRWAERLSQLPVDLFGKTVLVVGFGRVGSRVAKSCSALGMTIIVYDPYVGARAIEAAGCVAVSALDDALARADFVTIHCPKTPETQGMFNAARLGRMKRSAYLINTARGGIVDEEALHSALVRAELAGAGLDVFDREPPAANNPLLALPQVVLAPHMAGVTKESFDRMAVAVATNLLDFLDGNPKQDHVVNQEVLRHR